jgi:tetratricopeptide (TPR) repeat protein
MKTKKCLSVVLWIIVGLPLNGAGASESGGLPGAYLLDFAGDAAEFGQGGANVALVKTTAALYSNPAGLGDLASMEMSFVYARPFNDFNFFNGTIAYPFGKYGVFGMNLMSYRSPDAPRIDDFGIERGGTYSASDNAFSISYGKKFLDRYNIGVTLKMATQSIDNYSGLGVGADMGLNAKITDWLYAGLSLINLGGPTITLISSPDHFSTALTMGLGSRLLDDRLSIHVDLQRQEIFPDKKSYNQSSPAPPFRPCFGIEYWVIEYLGVRAGLTPNMFTLGTGFRLKGLNFDYAALIDRGEREFRNPLGHIFSLRYSFGKTIPQKELELNLELKDVEKKQLLRQAEHLFIDTLYMKADDTLRRYLEEYPKDREGLRLQAKLNEKLKSQKTVDLIGRARGAFARHDYEEAAKVLKELSEISPNSPAADSLNQKMVLIIKNKERLVVIKKLYAQGNYREMAKELDIVLSIDSTSKEAQEYRDKISKQVKRLEAEQHYNLATKFYYTDKDVEKANAEIQKALTLAPEYKEANELLAKIGPEIQTLYLKKVGRLVDKNNLTFDNKELQKLVHLDDQDRIQRAQGMLSNGQYEEALSEVESALKSDAKNNKAQELKKDIEKAISQRKAENTFNEALRLFNDTQIDSAGKKAQTAVDLVPDEPKYRQLLSDIRKKLLASDITRAKALRTSGKVDDVQAARLLIERYLEADPQNIEAQKLFVNIKIDLIIIDVNGNIDKGDFEKADQALQKALKLDPDNDKVKSAFKNLKDARAVLEQ